MDRFSHIHNLSELWALTVSVWRDGMMGVPVGQIALAILVLAVAIVIRRLFSHLVIRHIHWWWGRTKSATDHAIFEALAPPIRFIPVVFAIFIISEFITANPRAKLMLGEINRSLIVFTVFWALFLLVKPLFSIIDGRSPVFSEAMAGWAVRVGRIVFVALGSAAILEVWGIEVGPILASFGLFGVAVALGAQNVFKNLIAGIFIIGEERFRHGDWIKSDNVVEGTVETIGLRTTKVRRFDEAPVYVPNSALADNAVTNFSQMTYRRISWIVGLEYNTTVDQLRHIRDSIEGYLLGKEDFVRPPQADLFVHVDKFSDSSIDLMVYCFTRTTDWGAWLKIKEELIFAIKSIVEQAGSGFAFPSQSIYVETVPAGIAIGTAPPRAPGNPGPTS